MSLNRILKIGLIRNLDDFSKTAKNILKKKKRLTNTFILRLKMVDKNS